MFWTTFLNYLGIPENLRIKIDQNYNFCIEEVKYAVLQATFPMNPSYDEVVKANSMKGEEIKKTPLIHSPIFSNLTESDVYLKAEFR